MTSNQIAYAGVKTEERKVEETERHNKISEKQNDDQIALNAWIASTDAEYKKQSNIIAQQRLSLENDWNTRKLTNEAEYQKRSNELREMELSQKQWYNEQYIQIEQEGNRIRSAQQLEDARHNSQMEYISNLQNELNRQRLNFERYQFDTDMGLRRDALNLDTRRFEQQVINDYRNYSLGLDNLGVKVRANMIAQERLDLDTNQFIFDATMQQRRYNLDVVLPRMFGKIGQFFAK